MIPIRDNIPSQRTPVINYALIAVTGVVFLLQVAEGDRAQPLAERFGMVPARVLHPDRPAVIRQRVLRRTPFGLQEAELRKPVAPAAVNNWLTLLTCIFLHGGWLHFLGNMWFLFIFGDNVEDRFGHLGYLLFYLVCGVLASVSHLLSSPSSPVPTVGASGAIAGVMGSYFYLYPRATVLTLIPLFVFWEMIVLPAPLFLGIWFVIQLFQGVSVSGEPTAGVAWWAHIGGFAVGAGASALLGRTHLLFPASGRSRPEEEHVGHYRVYGPDSKW